MRNLTIVLVTLAIVAGIMMEVNAVDHPSKAKALVNDATFFNYLNLDYPGLEQVKTAVNSNNYSLAKGELLKYYQDCSATTRPRDFPLEITGDIGQADDNCDHYFTFQGNRGFAGADINWFNNPFTDNQWIRSLNHHGWLVNFGAVYAQTGNEKYAQEWMAQILEWINDCDVDDYHAHDTEYRIRSWVRSCQCFINQYNSPSISPNDYCTLMKSLREHLNYVYNQNSAGNHGSSQQVNLLYGATMFPEFKSAGNWQSRAAARLEGHLNDDFLADGVHVEMSPGYHDVALRHFVRASKHAELNNINPFSPGYIDSLENAIEFQMFINKPSQWTPAFSDTSRNRQYGGFLATGADLFDRQDMLYVYTSGSEGVPPAEISKGYPDGGYYIIRSEWGNVDNFDQSLYLVFDCGPLGQGQAAGNMSPDWRNSHGHADYLSFEAYAYGKELIIDPGRYLYAGQWREYFKITKAHNTIVIDNQSQVEYLGWEWGVPASYETKEWTTNNGFDFVHGWVSSPEYDVDHERKILFIRNEYWIISDILTGAGSHTFDQYFHLPKEAWGHTTLNTTTKTVTGTANNVMIVPADASEISVVMIDDWDEAGWGKKEQSPTVKYTKTGGVPESFDTVIYPFPSSTPSISITRLPVTRGGNGLSPYVASGLKIDINDDDDYYFVSHDEAALTCYGQFEFDGEVGYLRKNSSGTIINIQIKDGSELKENGAVLTTTYGVNACIRSSDHIVEISGADVINYRIWCPSAISVKIGGIEVSFTQDGNYVCKCR